MAEHKIELEKLKKAGIEPEVGEEFSIRLKDGTILTAKITEVEKDGVVIISK